jgi:oligoribonuclease
MLAIFLDMEATGLDFIQHRAIDLALKVVDLASGEVKGAYQSVVKQTEEVWERRDLASMEINGYTWDIVAQGKSPLEIKEEILALFGKLGIAKGKAFYICQNPAFDRGFFSHIIDLYTQEKLGWPYHWLDLASMYWALVVSCHNPIPESLNLSKNEIANAYHLPPEATPHKAINGVDHLILCYQAVVGFSQNTKR